MRDGGGGEDRLGALPDALLLLILANLGSTAEAARTSILARRWRSLWPELHVLVLRGVGPDTLDHLLGRARHGNLRRLEIQVRSPARGGIPATQISSLLRAADEHNPAELVFDVGHGGDGGDVPFELPCFMRAISMDLQIGSRSFTLTPPPASEFTFAALETLTLSLCRVDPGEFLRRCPRLRMLAMDCCWAHNAVEIHSGSLQEVVLKDMARPVAGGDRTPRRVDIAAPMPRKFRLECYGRAEMVASFSAPAPAAETLSFKYCSVWSRSIGLPVEGCLLSLATAMEWRSRYGQVNNPVLVRVLSMVILSNNYGYGNRSLAQEIVRLPVNNFSVLKLDLRTNYHDFGTLIFDLLKSLDSIQRLELELSWTPSEYFDYYDPDEWRNEHIWLPDLEELDIGGMNLTDHDIDFLKVIFTYAPYIKTVRIQLSAWVSQSDSGYKKLCRMFRENSSVKCYVNGVLEELPRRSNRLLRMRHQSA
ncbi:unnamed protein product [Urochloa decumbens]|uniref:FBD domain-containing protein n=1 Tax=Urochloa decumbens TaxID=240449 RepID=A0ABC8WK01_9POAL